MGVGKVIRILRKYFQKVELDLEFNKETNRFAGRANIGCGVGIGEVRVEVMDEYVASALILPQCVGQDIRGKAAELICRINYSMPFGKFDMDMNDGELRFLLIVSSVELLSDPQTKAEWLMVVPGLMVKKWGPAIVKLLLGVKTPEEAYAEGNANGIDDGGDGDDNKGDGKSISDKPCERRVAEPDVEAKRKSDKPKVDGAPSTVRQYSLEGLSVTGDIPVGKVVTAVRNFQKVSNDEDSPLPDRPRMNILLWGPPGVGKTEFVNYLGQQLGMKVCVKMASDILSHWCGKTEKAIRDAFDEAEEENAILFLDELDSLMQDRGGAHASWEVTQVNELLNAMETFKGVMIGATNNMDSLDKAVLRRFTYKICFDYLNNDGKRIFFDRAFKTPLSEKEWKRLEAIPDLTPGDFKTVSQKFYFLGDEVNNEQRLAALEEEVALKEGSRKRCRGFAA